MSSERDTKAAQSETAEVAEEEEVDEWDQRIFSTGCADENTKLNDCFYEKKDWRACKLEMTAFKECWKRQGNEARTASKES